MFWSSSYDLPWRSSHRFSINLFFCWNTMGFMGILTNKKLPSWVLVVLASDTWADSCTWYRSSYRLDAWRRWFRHMDRNLDADHTKRHLDWPSTCVDDLRVLAKLKGVVWRKFDNLVYTPGNTMKAVVQGSLRSIFLSHTTIFFYFENHYRFSKTDFTIRLPVGQNQGKSMKIFKNLKKRLKT